MNAHNKKTLLNSTSMPLANQTDPAQKPGSPQQAPTVATGKETVAARIDRWEAELEKNGDKVPENPLRQGEPYWHRIAVELGTSPHLLKAAGGPHELRIRGIADRLGLEPSGVGPRRESSTISPKIEAYGEVLRATRAKVPASRTDPTMPDFWQIGRELDADPLALSSTAYPFRGMILALAAEVGLEVRSATPVGKPATLAELGEIVRRDRRSDLVADPAGRHQNWTYNGSEEAQTKTLAALRALVGVSAESLESEAGPALAAALADPKFNADPPLREVLAECQTVLRHMQVDGLPRTFAAALDFVIKRSGLTLDELGSAAGVSVTTISGWLFVRSLPTRNAEASILKLEAVLGLRPGALFDRRPARRRVGARNFADRGRAAPRKPLRQKPASDQEERSAKAASVVTNGQRGRKRDSDTPYLHDWPADRVNGEVVYTRPSNWPDQPRGERDGFLIYRSDAMPPFGFARVGEPWSEGTQAIRDAALGRLFHHIACRHADCPGEKLSFALLLSAEFLHDYLASKSAARAKRTGQKTRFTSAEKGLVETVRGMFHEEYGWITQNPALADRLIPVAKPGKWIISPEVISAAQADWPAACAKAYGAYDKLYRTIYPSVTKVDTHEKIEPILRLPDPALAFRLGMAGLQQEIEHLERGGHGYNLAVRDRFIWGLASQTGLRVSNMMIEYSDADDREFRCVDGKYVICISRLKFKNANGPYFKTMNGLRDYYKVLQDIDGLYDTIREYLSYCRPILLKGGTSSALFVSHNYGDALSIFGLTRAIATTYDRFVKWDPVRGTGIKNARSAGVHWVRAVLATSVLKATGSLQLAADSIQDSGQVIREYYVRYLPEDRAEELDATLKAFLSSRMPEKQPEDLAAAVMGFLSSGLPEDRAEELVAALKAILAARGGDPR